MTQDYKKTLDYIHSHTSSKIDYGIILGSGLSELPKTILSKSIEIKNIPGFPASTVNGHSTTLLVGKIEEKNICCMLGRLHCYEGYSAFQACYPVRILKALGCKNIILTTSAGGIRKNLCKGDIMIIKDHINLSGQNPLVGVSIPGIERFCDLSEVYSPHLIHLAKKSAKYLNIVYKEGTHACMLGPSYETPSEIGFLKKIGAHTVSMSSTQEAIMSKALGMNTLGFACVTNQTGKESDTLSHLSVLSAAQIMQKKLGAWITQIIKMND